MLLWKLLESAPGQGRHRLLEHVRQAAKPRLAAWGLSRGLEA